MTMLMSINNQAVQNKWSLSSTRSSRGLMLVLDNIKRSRYFNCVNKSITMVQQRLLQRLSKLRYKKKKTKQNKTKGKRVTNKTFDEKEWWKE